MISPDPVFLPLKMNLRFISIRLTSIGNESAVLDMLSCYWSCNVIGKKHHTIEAYIKATEKELKGQGDISENKGYNSLSKVERIALKETNNCTDTIITKVHKEGAVIIIDKKDYINEAHRQ